MKIRHYLLKCTVVNHNVTKNNYLCKYGRSSFYFTDCLIFNEFTMLTDFDSELERDWNNSVIYYFNKKNHFWLKYLVFIHHIYII